MNLLQNPFSLWTLVAELLWHIKSLSFSVTKTIKMSIKKEAQKTFLQVPSSKLLVARIDDDVAKSMPNIHQSIPSSALVRNKGMLCKYVLLLNIIYRNMKSVYARYCLYVRIFFSTHRSINHKSKWFASLFHLHVFGQTSLLIG